MLSYNSTYTFSITYSPCTCTLHPEFNTPCDTLPNYDSCTVWARMHICIYAHTYARSAKRCLDPPRTTLEFAHALHTATSTSAITPTKNICAASSAYQIPRYTCVLNIRRHMHTHASMPVYNKLHHFSASVCEVSVRVCARFHCERARTCTSVFDTSVQAQPKVQ